MGARKQGAPLTYVACPKTQHFGSARASLCHSPSLSDLKASVAEAKQAPEGKGTMIIGVVWYVSTATRVSFIRDRTDCLCLCDGRSWKFERGRADDRRGIGEHLFGYAVQCYLPFDGSYIGSRRAGRHVVERFRRGLVLVHLYNKEAVSGTWARVMMNALGLVSLE